MAPTDEILDRDRLALVAVIDRGAPGWPHLAEVDPEPTVADKREAVSQERRLCDQQPPEMLLCERRLMSPPDSLTSYEAHTHHDRRHRSAGQLETC